MKRGLVILCAITACCEEPERMCEGPNCGPVWREGEIMPGRRLEPGVGALGTRLVVAGGISTSLSEGLTITPEVIAFDTLVGTWDSLPDLPVAWTHAAVAGVGATLYVLGGLEGPDFVARGEAFALDLGATEWRPIAAMPAGLERGAAGVVVSPPHIYLLGGASTTSAVATCLDYDLGLDTWTQLPDLPSARSHPAAMRDDDGTLIVAGGLGDLGSSRPLADVDALPPTGESWIPRAPMPTPRGGCAYGVSYGQLVCAGGESGGSALSVVESYDADLDAWMERSTLPEPRAGTKGASIGQQLYVPGGARALVFEPLDTLYVFGLIAP